MSRRTGAVIGGVVAFCLVCCLLLAAAAALVWTWVHRQSTAAARWQLLHSSVTGGPAPSTTPPQVHFITLSNRSCEGALHKCLHVGYSPGHSPTVTGCHLKQETHFFPGRQHTDRSLSPIRLKHFINLRFWASVEVMLGVGVGVAGCDTAGGEALPGGELRARAPAPPPARAGALWRSLRRLQR